jgi:hypothetical protein
MSLSHRIGLSGYWADGGPVRLVAAADDGKRLSHVGTINTKSWSEENTAL